MCMSKLEGWGSSIRTGLMAILVAVLLGYAVVSVLKSGLLR